VTMLGNEGGKLESEKEENCPNRVGLVMVPYVVF